MHLHPSPRQRDLMDTAYELAMTRFAKRTAEIRQRARAAHTMVQRNAVAVRQEAMRICGGRALLRQFPFEHYARCARIFRYAALDTGGGD